MSDDLDTEFDELDDGEDDDAGSADGSNPLRGVVRKLERRLKATEKKHQQALEEAKSQAIEEYQARQQKVAQAKEVFGGLGYQGFAEDFLALHPDTAEVAPTAAKEWLESRGLQVKEGDEQQDQQASPQQPQPQAPSPPPVSRFHEAGSSGTPTQARLSPEEFRALVTRDPAEARRVAQEGLVDYDRRTARESS